jgi:hypothetical protein
MLFLCERLRAITYVKAPVLRQISRGDLLGCRLVGSFLTPLNQTQVRRTAHGAGGGGGMGEVRGTGRKLGSWERAQWW